MKLVVQRVKMAAVEVDSAEVSRIGAGLLVLIGIEKGDTETDAIRFASKIANLRIFNDEQGVMNLSVVAAGGEVMVVSQFTLAALTRKGHRPSYINAAGHELAIPLYESFCEHVGKLIGRDVKRGIFGADMQVKLINDGPVTIIIDSNEL